MDDKTLNLWRQIERSRRRGAGQLSERERGSAPWRRAS